MLSNPDLLTLADANLAEFAREATRWLPPHRIEEHADLLLTAANTRFPAGPWNCAMPLGNQPADPERTLEEARAFFAARDRGFTVYVRDHLDGELRDACIALGYTRSSDSPGMALTERVSPSEPAAGVVVREVRSRSDARAFVEVMANAYEALQMRAAVTRKLLSFSGRWLGPHIDVRLVLENDRPVSGALMLLSHGIAGVYWVGTVADARGRGHAERVMRSISNHAFDVGARAVVLQATPFGEPVYRRVGYHELTRYPLYVVPAPVP